MERATLVIYLHFVVQRHLVRRRQRREHAAQSSILRRPVQMSGLIPPKVLGVQNGRRTGAEFRPRV